jgi:hypothetical protein
MANRPRLDPEVAAEVVSYIDELLAANGVVTDIEVGRIAEAVDRSTRQVRRLIDSRRTTLDLPAPIRAPRPAPTGDGSSLDAMLAGQAFRFDDELCEVVMAYAGNLRALHRDALRISEGELLSYSQLNRKYRREVPNDVQATARSGIKGFKSTSMYVRWSAAHRNEVWQIDATQLDLWIRPRGSGAAVRPWVLCIIDDYSRVVLSATVMLHEYNAADSMSCALRALRPRDVTLPDGATTTVGGVPGKILCDNAMQFTGELMSTVALELGFVMWAVAVYSGEQKGKVERLLRDANEDLCRLLPGYANPNRKTYTMRDQLRGTNDDALDEVQFLDELARWVEEKNTSPHPTVPGRSRYEVWAGDGETLRFADEDQIRPITVPLSSRDYVMHKSGFRIQRDGVATYYLGAEMAGMVGDRFQLRHIPGETAWVEAYRPDGTLVGRCWDSSLFTDEQRAEITRNRAERYRTIASLHSAAVELRAAAAATERDSERPNPIAAASARTAAPAAPELVAASLGIHTDTADVLDVDAVDDAELGSGDEPPVIDPALDALAEAAVAPTSSPGAGASASKKTAGRTRSSQRTSAKQTAAKKTKRKAA